MNTLLKKYVLAFWFWTEILKEVEVAFEIWLLKGVGMTLKMEGIKEVEILL